VGSVEKRNVNLTEQYCTTSAQFDIALTASTTYYIRVSSYTGSPYADPSNVAIGGTLHLSITQPVGPANDDFANATTVTLSEYQGFYEEGGKVYATIEAGEPAPSCSPTSLSLKH